MAEQNIRPGMHPAEGRSDVSADLEEEQRNAYSAHRAGTSFHREEAARKALREPELELPQEAGMLPPVEGRLDVAADLEEEQRNAYSAHRAETSH